MKYEHILVAGTLTVQMDSSEASLIDRGGGLIYDNTLNITWLQDANYSKSNNSDSDGLMSHYVAKEWAHDLIRQYDSAPRPTRLRRHITDKGYSLVAMKEG